MLNSPLYSKTEHEIFYLHLNAINQVVVDDLIIISTLAHALKEANHSRSYEKSTPFNPVMGYMSVLDQLGNCYSLKSKSTSVTGGIKRALELFGPALSSDEIKALYAIRNAIMHNSSLINLGENTTPTLVFTIVDMLTPFTNKLPPTPAIKKLNTEIYSSINDPIEPKHVCELSLLGLAETTGYCVNQAQSALEDGDLIFNNNTITKYNIVSAKDYIIKRHLLVVQR